MRSLHHRVCGLRRTQVIGSLDSDVLPSCAPLDLLSQVGKLDALARATVRLILCCGRARTPHEYPARKLLSVDLLIPSIGGEPMNALTSPKLRKVFPPQPLPASPLRLPHLPARGLAGPRRPAARQLA